MKYRLVKWPGMSGQDVDPRQMVVLGQDLTRDDAHTLAATLTGDSRWAEGKWGGLVEGWQMYIEAMPFPAYNVHMAHELNDADIGVGLSLYHARTLVEVTAGEGLVWDSEHMGGHDGFHEYSIYINHKEI